MKNEFSGVRARSDKGPKRGNQMKMKKGDKGVVVLWEVLSGNNDCRLLYNKSTEAVTR